MNLLHKLQLHVYLFWAVVFGCILLSALMVLPFVSAIISAYILAYLLKPLFIRLKPRFGRTASALLCIVAAFILVVVPIGLIAMQVFYAAGGISTGQGVANIVDPLIAQPFLRFLHIDAVGLKEWIILAANNVVNSAIQSIPSFGLGLIITLNGMFYLLCNWDNLAKHINKYLPFKNNDRIIKELGDTADSIIHGHVLISVLEAVIAFIGFYAAGVNASLIFAALIFMLAFIPSIGPVLVWGPLALYYFSISQYSTMIGVIVTGLALMVGIEFFLYTRFVGSRSHIHPFIMLIGVLGGISVFGIFGFIIGPLLLANSIKIVEGAIGSEEVSISSGWSE